MSVLDFTSAACEDKKKSLCRKKAKCKQVITATEI
jgi:hypothetical protein